jgi:transcriptional regulator with GAF, ATPase, and Fis domain
MICADGKNRDPRQEPGRGDEAASPAMVAGPLVFRELMDLVRRIVDEVRRLEGSVERAAAACQGRQGEPERLPKGLRESGAAARAIPRIPGASLRELERYAILETLEHVGGSTSKAAKILQISPRKIQYRLNEYRSADTEQPPPSKRDGIG